MESPEQASDRTLPIAGSFGAAVVRSLDSRLPAVNDNDDPEPPPAAAAPIPRIAPWFLVAVRGQFGAGCLREVA